MKKAIFFLSFIFIFSENATAQSTDRKAIASSGGYFSGNNISLSWTLGETFSTSIANSSYILSQGFQQTYLSTIKLRLFLEGYYLNNHTMTPALYNQGVPNATMAQVDTIKISLLDTISLENIYSTNGILDTSGFLSITIPEIYIGRPCFMKIAHRNSIPIYSKKPIFIGKKDFIDFTAGN
jgi:hypothetical protein